MVALGGVVVDDVQDDLDAGRVQCLDHRLELADLLAALPGRAVAVVRREEADRVVAPVVRQAARHHGLLGDELVHREQLDGRGADPLEVLDDRRVGEARVRAALVQRDLRVAQRQAADVRLVDDRVVVRDVRRAVVAPVKERVYDHIFRHKRSAVDRVRPPRVRPLVVEKRLVPRDIALDGLAVGVKQQLRRRATRAEPRVIRAVDAVAVALPGADRRQVPVPDEAVDLGQLDARLGTRLIEQAQLNPLGDLGEQGEVRPPSVPRRAKRVRGPWPGMHPPPHAGRP